MEKEPDINETLALRDMAGLRLTVPNLTNEQVIRDIHAGLKHLIVVLETKLGKKQVAKPQDLAIR